MEDIARFGKEVRSRLKAAKESLTGETLGRFIEGYSGRTNGHQLLHQVLSHTAHHLRQLYEMLRMIGVEPKTLLSDQDFEGISMPRDLW